MIVPGFCGGSYQSQSPLADNERTVNWYPEHLEAPDATTRVALYPTPGVKVLGTDSTAPGLAHFAENGREFAVIGSDFVEIDAYGALTSRGAVAVGNTPATICSNGQAGGQLMVTAGTNVYIFTPATNLLVQVAAMNGLATMGGQLDGYFLVLDATKSTVWFSNLNDGLTWQGVNFFKRNIQSDPWFSMKIANRYIYLFGTQTSEVWYDAGTFPLPFAPYTSSVIPWGCAAQFSPVVADGKICWLGASKDGQNMIVQASGSTVSVISTYAISNVLNGYSTITDAVGDAYSSLGHTFFMFSFPTANAPTLCYDGDTSMWHERGTWISESNAYAAWRPRYHAFAFGQHRMLDSSLGTVYQMSETLTSDVDARSIRRLRIPPPLFYQNQRLFVDSFELDMEPGLGNTMDPGSNPQAMMSISQDGGKTWGIERQRSVGKIGQYNTRARWNRCGMARRMVFSVSVTDAVPWRVMGAFVKMRQPPTGMSQYQQAQWQS